MSSRLWTVLLFLVLVPRGWLAAADTPVETARQLMTRVQEARKIQGIRGRLRLIRVNARTGERVVKQLIFKMRQSGSVTTTLYQLVAARNTAGQALLLEVLAGKPPTGYFLDGSNQVIRLSPAMLEQPFFGSDIPVGDLTDDFLWWPTHRIVREEEMLRRTCAVIESRPPAAWTGTTARCLSWISRDLALPLKVERYDATGRMLRRLAAEKVANPEGRGWIITQLTVVPAGQDTRTTLAGTRGHSDVVVPAAEFDLDLIRRSLRPRA